MDLFLAAVNPLGARKIVATLFRTFSELSEPQQKICLLIKVVVEPLICPWIKFEPVWAKGCHSVAILVNVTISLPKTVDDPETELRLRMVSPQLNLSLRLLQDQISDAQSEINDKSWRTNWNYLSEEHFPATNDFPRASGMSRGTRIGLKFLYKSSGKRKSRRKSS